MPGYIERSLQRFKHTKPTKSEDASHIWIKSAYGKRMQFAKINDLPYLDAGNKKKVQEILGTLLYYAHAIDSTMLVALSSIAAQQAASIKNTM